MTGKLSILIYSQQELLFKMLDKQRHDFNDLLLFPIKQSESALLFLKDTSMYPLIIVADESADIWVLKNTLQSLKHHGKHVFALYTGTFSSKSLAMSFACGFDEFLAAPVSLHHIIQLASKKGLASDIKQHFNTTNIEN